MCWSVLAWRSLAVFTGVLLTAEGLYYMLRYVRKFREQKPKVLFFPIPVTCVRPLLLSPRRCDCSLPHGESALSSLARLLLGASRSLDVCVFSISSPDLGSLVLAVHGRGVRVRVITDSDYMALAGSQVGIFRKAGIEVRHDQDTNYMHHKFALIDGSILVTGSLNWSAQAVFRNKENVVIIEDFDIVKAFIEEFEQLWNEYDPTKYSFSPQSMQPISDKIPSLHRNLVSIMATSQLLDKYVKIKHSEDTPQINSMQKISPHMVTKRLRMNCQDGRKIQPTISPLRCTFSKLFLT